MGKQSPEQVRQTFWRERGDVGADVQSFAEDLFRVATDRATEINGLIEGHAQHWRMERMAAVDRNLMRAAVAEQLLASFPVRSRCNSSTACWTAWARNWKAVVSRQSLVVSLQTAASSYRVRDGTSEDACAYMGQRRTTNDCTYGLIAIKSGLQVKVTPLHRPDRSVVASVGKEICCISALLCVSRICTWPSVAAI